MSSESDIKKAIQLKQEVIGLSDDGLLVFLTTLLSTRDIDRLRRVCQSIPDRQLQNVIPTLQRDPDPVTFFCPECHANQDVTAEAVEMGKCYQAVLDDGSGYFELDWVDDCCFDVRREYRCSGCGGKLADTIDELQDVIKAYRSSGSIQFKHDKNKTVNEELGILGK